MSRSVDSPATSVAQRSQNLSHVADRPAHECGSLHESISSLSGAATAETAHEACGIADRL
ncbi:hypothetical protein [Oryzomonas rubra]|uniref:Uncharacterized protein n=1 Tax=Oryzomonas rubra TaxID=2509454 RepID=A0A5A9XIF6_9BACT|nr:hypothetical protein [Oryzomonas rubra]KAA0892285.1 hypothetical protein ET418_08825 [Oryzomonas rubra]